MLDMIITTYELVWIEYRLANAPGQQTWLLQQELNLLN